MIVADFLEEKKREINARLDELRPLVQEYERLQAAVGALEGVSSSGGAGGGGGSSRGGARRGRRPASADGESGAAGNGRRGRPRGTGTRSKQALELVRDNPGISIPELSEKMEIQQNYLYRVLPGLQKDGLVRKDGRGWYALEAA